MNRRSFLRGLGMVVAGVAIDKAIPMGRVWSFPSKIVLTSADTIALQLERVQAQLPLLFEDLRTAQRLMVEGIRSSTIDPSTIFIHPAQKRQYLKLIGE